MHLNKLLINSIINKIIILCFVKKYYSLPFRKFGYKFMKNTMRSNEILMAQALSRLILITPRRNRFCAVT
jgi:hypothetical protein